MTGLFVDISNSILVSCGLDGHICFWDFHQHTLLAQLTLASAQLFLCGFKDAGFAAVIGQDRVVRIYDVITHKLVRRFSGHAREITDTAFSPDGTNKSNGYHKTIYVSILAVLSHV